MRPALFAIMALAAVGALVAPGAPSVWQDRPRPKQRPQVQKMVGGTDEEINAWNAEVDKRNANKKASK